MKLPFDRSFLEIVIALVAAITGSFAALGAFAGATFEEQRLDLEKAPAIHLSCSAEYSNRDLAEHRSGPAETLLLAEDGGTLLHVPVAGDEPAQSPFARCSVTNYGRLPVLDVRIAVHFAVLRSAGQENRPATAIVVIPGLSPDATFEFGLLNGADARLRVSMDRTASVTRVNAPGPSIEKLYADDGVVALEERPVEAPDGTRRDARIAGPLSIAIRNFAFVPGAVHIRAGTTLSFFNHDGEAHTVTDRGRSFDSGVLKADVVWRHTFTKPGRYVYVCRYHPYMKGSIVVTR